MQRAEFQACKTNEQLARVGMTYSVIAEHCHVAAWNTKQEETCADLSTYKTPPQNDDVSTAVTKQAPCLARNPNVQILGLVSFGSDRAVSIMSTLSD
jgi:hypothetical protein